MFKHRQWIVMAATVAAASGCSSDGPVDPGGNGSGSGGSGSGNVAVASVIVTPATVQLAPGERSILSATVLDGAGNALSRTVTWRSSNPAVAVVSTTGEVTAVAAGDVTISATAADRTGAAAVAVRTIPPTATITVNNQLIYPVRVAIGGVAAGLVPAQGARSFTLAANVTTEVDWDLERPLLGSQPLGEPMGGIFTVTAAAGSTRSLTVDNLVGSTWYFAPLITNRTNQALLMAVNYRLQSENRCQCTAPAGLTRVHLGYYRLFSNGNVTAFRDGSGYGGSFVYFDNFAPSVTQGSGTREFIFTVTP